MEGRERWATKLGLILAMAGNAVGLGNFWRFPYQLAKNGGGAFMIPYFIALLLLGIPIMWVEWVTGRFGGKYGHGVLGPTFYLMSRESVKPRTALIFGIIGGMLAFSVTTLLNSYYLHVVGWSVAYTYYSATGAYYGQNTVAFFINHVNNLTAVLASWGLAVVLLAIATSRGVAKGIEAWNKVMMPLLYVFAVVLVARSLTLGSPVKPEWSSLAGLEYIWKPDFNTLSQNFFRISLAAAGQIFFTLSLGMGIIQNYASYVGKDDDIALSGLATVSLNEFAEVVLGGSLAIPIAFAYLGPEQAIKGGVGLAYMSLPNVFTAMGEAGRLFGSMWFLLLFFAGFTSAIAMYNYLVALLEEDLHIKRTLAAVIVFILYLLLGLPVALDGTLVYLSELDNWVGSYFLVLLGLFDIIVAVWLFKPKNLWDELHRGAYINVPTFFKYILLIATPIYIALLLAGTTYDYYNMGAFTASKTYVEEVLGGSYPDSVPIVTWARVAMIAILIIGALETYYSIRRKYGEELKQNRKIVVAGD
ncbi:MAG: Na+dependent transporter [Zestosphaera tikiterensis]|uniref:Transporter n=1 Tax=Zestosphaera tikiterensis TaxID=1973259 RepID=A0A2R7Y5Z7_9CREN|nr:MAG: Na+dependent transporter [Zestosphaera tikiterensis]